MIVVSCLRRIVTNSKSNYIFFFFNKKTAYEMRISDWSSDVCSSDLTGPADGLDNCELFFLEALRSARQRIWIASPYFVPDEQIVSALELARLRGVEVRILLPQRVDRMLVQLASYGYYAMAERAGIEIYRYQPGFLHQKVLLVDDDIVSIGTANLDNRSFRLNFELSIVVADRPFSAAVAAMLREDFARSSEHTSELLSLMRNSTPVFSADGHTLSLNAALPILVKLAGYGYVAMAERAGIEIYRYQPGFLHQKVLLVDDDIVSIGTANLDNRSFRLNFELSIVVADRPFSAAVEAMLREDFALSRRVAPGELDERSFWFRFGVGLSRLLAPVL